MKKKLSKDEEFQILHDVIINENNEILVEQYYNLIQYHVKKKLIKITGKVENDQVYELTNEVFIKLLENDHHRLKEYNPEYAKGGLSGWIILITIRTVIDIMKKKYINILLEDEELKSISDPENFHKKTEIQIDKKKLLTLGKKILSEREYDVFKLLFDGYSIAEISKKIDEKASNCSILRWRAIDKLKKYISKNGF